MAEPVRLQKFLSRAEVASRRRAEVMIAAGRVRVNGRVVTEMGVQVDPERDRVEVDGAVVAPRAALWIALHKPRGCVTTRDDPRGRRTVYDLLPPDLRGLFHVGRLDYGTEGLLLLTNEGVLAHRLLHPRYGVERVYEVVAEGDVAPATLARLRGGVALGDGVARAEAVERLRFGRPGRTRLKLTMREGRKREVRRLMKAVGHPVRRLVRRRYGPIRLGALESGAWRRLEPREVAALERESEWT